MGKPDPPISTAGWPVRMSKPLAAKGIGACLKHVLNARLWPVRLVLRRGDGFDVELASNGSTTFKAALTVTEPVRRLAEDAPLPPCNDRPAERSRSWLEETFRTARPRLLGLLARKGEIDRAEDLIQDLFVNIAARSGNPGNEIDNPIAYLGQSLRNLEFDRARSAHRRSTHLHEPLDEDRIADSDPVAVLEARDRLVRLDQAVGRLKPLTRDIFLARRLDGYSYAEIAEKTGLSVKGVEKQMSRAIKQLGRHLRRDD